MTETTSAIADKVRGVAAEKRLTQARVAEVLNMSRTSVVERMQGRIAFTGAELFTLSCVLRVPITRLFPDATEARTLTSHAA